MALFPSAISIDEKGQSKDENRGWLKNRSFQVDTTRLGPPAQSSAKEVEEVIRKGKESRRNQHGLEVKSKESLQEREDQEYRVDRKPDPNNRMYDSLYSGDIANYRRKFGGQCLGLGQKQKLNWTDKKGSATADKKVKTTRYFKETAAAEPASSILQAGDRRSVAECVSGGLLPLETPYLHSPAEQSPECYVTQRSAKYNQQLQEDPHNVVLWLEFICFQDEALVWGKLPDDSSQVSEVKKKRLALVERKLAIYEQAVGRNPLSVELIVGQMDLCVEVWEAERVMRRWKALVFQQPNKPELWLKYIEYCQSNFSSFSVSSLSSLYSKCISTLSSIQEGILASHSPHPNTDQYLIAIFSLYCTFLVQAGYSEKAIASFQALVEFNLCCPVEFEGSILSKERLAYFETFWDSNVPRIGDVNAPGWRFWMLSTQEKKVESKSLCCVDDTRSTEVISGEGDIDLDSVSLTEAWLHVEQSREKHHWLPCKASTDEEELSDPERMVLFDDISPYMFSTSHKLELFLAYLHFLGALLHLSPTPQGCWQYVSRCFESPPEVFSTPMPLLTSGNLCSSSLTPALHRPLVAGEAYMALHGGSLLDVTACMLSPSFTKLEASASHFISNTFNHSLSLFSHNPSAQSVLAQLWMEFEMSLVVAGSSAGRDVKRKVKRLRRLFKSLLRLDVHGSNASLWSCYGCFEHLVNGCAEAVTVFEKVLAQASPHGTPQAEVAGVYLVFAQCLLRVRVPLVTQSPPPPPQEQAALHALACLSEGAYTCSSGPVSPTRIIKARRSYQTAVSKIFEDGSCSWNVVTLLVCFAYFEYLTVGMQSVDSLFNKAVESVSCKLDKCGRSSELFAQLEFLLRSQLLLFHKQEETKPTQPLLLRQVLYKSLQHAPDSSLFLSSFVVTEQDSSITRRVRKYFSSNAAKSCTAVPWLFSVSAEVHQQHKLLSCDATTTGSCDQFNSYRIRAVFSQATASQAGRLCPLLWRLYMKYEVEVGNYSAAKAVFYQAIHLCPWAKVLYFDAVSYFPTEASKIFEILEEKELRIRTPLEEIQLMRT